MHQTFWKGDVPTRVDVAAEKECLRCGKALRRQKPSQMAKRTFCSSVCAYLHRVETNAILLRACPVCSKPVLVAIQKTCSAACGYELRKRTLRPQKACEHCGVLFWPSRRGGKACSRKCYFAIVGRRPAMQETSCAMCGKTFRRTAGALKRVTRSFCSRACSAGFHCGEQAPMFRGDKDPNRGAAWNKLAAAIRERDCFSCRRCGRCEGSNGPRSEKLSVDHVIPWRSFKDKALANHPDNLVSLCRKCHSHKTSKVERAYLKGDVIAWKQWVRSLHLKSAVRGISVHQDAAGEWVVTKQFTFDAVS